MNDKKQPIEYILYSIVARQLKLLEINKDWRAGQALFNALHDLYPSIANKIRDTENDPFHNNKKTSDCFVAIINIYKENE